MGAEKFLRHRDAIIDTCTDKGGLVFLQYKAGKFPWTKENWSKWPKNTWAQDRCSKQVSGVHAAKFKLNLNVTEHWDENHDVDNDVIGVYKAEKLYSFILVVLCKHNFKHGPQREKDVRFWQFKQCVQMLFDTFSANTCASFERHGPDMLKQFAGKIECKSNQTQ